MKYGWKANFREYLPKPRVQAASIKPGCHFFLHKRWHVSSPNAGMFHVWTLGCFWPKCCCVSCLNAGVFLVQTLACFMSERLSVSCPNAGVLSESWAVSGPNAGMFLVPMLGCFWSQRWGVSCLNAGLFLVLTLGCFWSNFCIFLCARAHYFTSDMIHLYLLLMYLWIADICVLILYLLLFLAG